MFNRSLIDAVARLTERVRDCEQKLSTASSTAMLVRVNELEAALEQLQKSNRREFGKLWKHFDKQTPANGGGGALDVDSDDPEFAAMIALQRAHGST